MAQHPGKHANRIASLALPFLILGPATVMAATPIRGLACVRAAGQVYALLPLVQGPGHTIRAVRADFTPFWLEIADTGARALDSRCLVGTNENGYLARMDGDRGAKPAGVPKDAIEIVAASVSP